MNIRPTRVAAMLIALLACSATQFANATDETVYRLIRTTLMLDTHPSVGGKIYRDNCANCHGTKGEGNRKGMPTLAGQRLAYLVKQFADFAEEDRDGKTMHRVIADKSLKEPQTWIDLAAYINALPPAKSVDHGDGKYLQLGEAIFVEQCSSCHEADARGDDDGFVPSLRNQHYSYLVRQLRDIGNEHRRNVDAELAAYFASLDKEEKEGVADFLSRFGGPTKNRLQMRQNGVTTD